VSEPYDPENLLDRWSDPGRLELHYQHLYVREREVLAKSLPLAGGDVLSVGCGWHPGRHLFPRPSFRITGVDLNPDKVRSVVETGRADAGLVGSAGHLDELPDASFDVVLYRLVLHHIAYQGSLTPCLTEAVRLLRPGGAFVAVEPNLLHPVGAGLALANRLGLGRRVHGTPDDLPLRPGRLLRDARSAGLEPELYALTCSWRRLPRWLQRALHRLDRLGSLPGARALGHTFLLLGRRPAGA
jgi:SAM-dependent methyltransferase